MDAIRQKYADVQTNLITGSGGIFDVVIDGEKVFSKFDTGRFPENREILAKIQERLQKA